MMKKGMLNIEAYLDKKPMEKAPKGDKKPPKKKPAKKKK